MSRKDRRSSRPDEVGILRGEAGVKPTPPATNDSPIKGPTKPSKQPRKNLTNSDPPATKAVPGDSGESEISTRRRTPGNPDPNPKPTSGDPQRQKVGAVVSRSDIQYVPSSTTVNRFINGDLILPASIDEAELSCSLDIYDEMLLDPTIAGIRLWMLVNTLSDGLSFTARTFEAPYGEEQPNPVDLQEADWSRRYIVSAYERLQFTDRNIMLICWDLLDGARIPHKLAEATFDTIQYGDFAGLPGVRLLKPKPRKNYNLVYDTNNTFRGIVAMVAGGSTALWSGYISDVSTLPNAIAAEKLVMFMADDRDGIPKSLYNAVYGPWARCLSLYADMMETSRGSAGGKVSLELSDKAAQDFQDPITGETITGEMASQRALSQWGNNGTLTHPNGSKAQVWFPPGNALTSFIEALKMSKNEMAIALTTNAKAILEGEHGSGLSEDNAGDDAQPVIEMLKWKLCASLNKLSFVLLKLAKGEQYAMRYCPESNMSRGDIMDFPAAGTAWAAIATSEGVTPSQWPEYARMIGVKAPNAAEMTTIGQTWLKQQELKANPPQPVAPGAGSFQKKGPLPSSGSS